MKRYDPKCDGQMVPHYTGDWVRYADVQAELTQLRAERLLLAKLACDRFEDLSAAEVGATMELAERIVEGGGA